MDRNLQEIVCRLYNTFGLVSNGRTKSEGGCLPGNKEWDDDNVAGAIGLGFIGERKTWHKVSSCSKADFVSIVSNVVN